MTFYSHYDTIEDIFHEFVDDMEAEIIEALSKESVFDIDKLFEVLNGMMFEEIDFFRSVAKDTRLEIFRRGCKETISQLIRVDLKQGKDEPETTRLIVADLTATCIAYSYFDWLAGNYGDVPLGTVTAITKEMLSAQLKNIHYR